MNPIVTSILLLVCSNVFMTFPLLMLFHGLPFSQLKQFYFGKRENDRS